jgi:hypothetical protein
MTEHATTAEQWAPEVIVRIYRGGHLIEQRFCESPESVAEIIESREARGTPSGELIIVEPHPPEVIIAVLRAIADAIEEDRPVAMPSPFPHIRLQLLTEGTEATRPTHGELHLLLQDLAHPGD